MCYRIGTCPTWQFNRNEIIKHFKEGDSAIRVAFNELIEAGFLVRRRTRAERGRFSKMEYEIYEKPINKDSSPCVENPHVDNAQMEKPRVANQPHNNKEVINKEYNNKDSSSDKFGNPDFLENKKKEEDKNLKDLEEILILTKNAKSLPEDKIKFFIKRYFDIKWPNNNAEEFLDVWKENIQEAFRKLPYLAAKWMDKYENEILPLRELKKSKEYKESSNPTWVPTENSNAIKLNKAINEYCRKKHCNPSSLTKEEINKIKEELENDET
jgi:hypothetical protein